jgi:tetratricopeptide (TPR) repeat protein
MARVSAHAAKAGTGQTTSPRLSTALSVRAASRWKRGRRAEAIEDAHRAVLLEPDNLLAFREFLSLSLGLIHDDGLAHRTRLYAAADDILRRDPACVWARAARVALAHTNSYQVSNFSHQQYTDDLQQLTRLEPSRVWCWAFLGRIRRKLEDLDKAVEVGPKVGWVRAWRGELLRATSRDTKGAMKDYDAAIRLDPHYPHTFAWRARLRDQMGNKEGALADLERFAGPEQRAYHLQHRATLHWEAGEDGKCLEDLKGCMIRSPFHAFAYGGLGACLPPPLREHPRGYFAPTAQRIERLARQHPDFALGHAWLGRLSLDAGRLVAARRSLEEAVRLDPNCCLAACWLAEYWLRAHKPAVALRLLNEALRLHPGFFMALLWRVKAAAALRKYSIAAKDLSAAANTFATQRTDAPKTDLLTLWRKHALGAAARKALDVARQTKPGPSKRPRLTGLDVAVDPRVELIAALDCLTKPNPCPLAEESLHRARLLTALDKDHPACRLYASLKPAFWNGRGPAAVLLECSPLPELRPPAGLAAQPGMDGLLAALRDFAAGGLRDFMHRERGLYASLVAPIGELFSQPELQNELQAYLGVKEPFDFHIIVSPLYHGILIDETVVRRTDGRWQGYMLNGHTNIGPDSEPVAELDECSVWRCSARQAARCALEAVGGAEAADWAEAAACRLTAQHFGESAAARLSSESGQVSRVAQLCERLADYERHRAKYPTIRDFIASR